MTSLTDAVKSLLDGPNFAHVAIDDPPRSPHASVVWIDRDGDRIKFNTAEGRRKPELIRQAGTLTISITDQANPYSSAMIRGNVVEITQEGARDHIDVLAKKYMDADTYPFYAGETRVIVVIEPTEVVDNTQ